MSRRYLGASEVNIPIDSILAEFAAWKDELVDAVGKELLREVRSNADVDFYDQTGNLRASIARKKSKYDKDTHIVGAFAPHAHLVEFGTDVRVSKKTGKVSGHMPATLFMTAAGQAVEARLGEIVKGAVAPKVVVKK